MKLGKIVYIVIIVILVAVFGISAFHVGDYLLESRKEQSQFDELAALKEQAAQNSTRPPETTAPAETEAPEETTVPEETTEPTEPPILQDYAAIYEENNHVVGWIKIDGTKVDYPVMQTPEEPNYYLKRNFKGQYSEHGCIYIREECDMNNNRPKRYPTSHDVRRPAGLPGQGYLGEQSPDLLRYPDGVSHL